MPNPEYEHYEKAKPSALDDPVRHPSDEYFDKTFKAAVDEKDGKIRKFDTGATRDTDDGKLDYEGFLSPSALARYAVYMHSHRKQSDGKMRDSDNWQKGIPLDCYMKSLWRHFIEAWTSHRSETHDSYEMEDSLCAVIFNAFGYLHEITKGDTLADEETRSFGVGSQLPKDLPAKEWKLKDTCDRCNCYNACALPQKDRGAMLHVCVSFVRKKEA